MKLITRTTEIVKAKVSGEYYERPVYVLLCPKCGRHLLRRSWWSVKTSKACSDCTKSNLVHGIRHHKLYTVWMRMLTCCYKEGSHAYHNYGGRGIKVCAAWRYSVAAFYNWAITHGWKPGLQIERINNNGNYTPGNCCFANHVTQGRNRRTNKLNEMKVSQIRKALCGGATKTSLAKKYGVSVASIYLIAKGKNWKGVA